MSILYLVLLSSGLDTFLPPPAPIYCPANEACRRPDLFAFQFVAWFCILYCGLVGYREWPRLQHLNTPEARLYAYHPPAERLVACNLLFQFFDFCISWTITEQATPVMLTHHCLAAVVSASALHGGLLGYYAVFFLGLTEVSSLFLVWVDLGTYFPPEPGSMLHLFVNLGMGSLFAVSFFYYRVFLWWPLSLRIWKDTWYMTRKSTKLDRPLWVLYLLCIVNVPLGLMQLYWSTVVLREAHNVLLGT